ncbi:MAG: DUF4926 domain-containing protein [bacterium]|nr:DUF4926 domain-containing protein [bacterium]
MFEELDIVVLNHDIEKYSLKKGAIGTIVYVYKNKKGAEVEFMTDEGKTIAVLTLNFTDISSKSEIDLKSHKSDRIINHSTIGDLPFIYPMFIYPYT